MDAIGTLDAYSFIIRRPADVALNLHRLVHLATRNWLRKEELLNQWTERAILRLEEVFPNHNHKNRGLWRIYLPHARCALLSDIVDKDREIRISLTWRFGMCLYRDRQYNEAEVSFMEVVEKQKKLLGAEHPSTLISMGNLASTFWNQGRWKEAEELQAKELKICSRVLGEKHPDTLTSIGNLASTYRNQGRWKEAEELDVQVMETRKRVLGEEHPDTLTSMGNLAYTLMSQSRNEEAISLMKQCFQLQKKTLGPQHPYTQTSLEALSEWENMVIGL